MHHLARELGMMVSEIETRMSAKEFRNWLVFWEHEHGQRQTMSEALEEISKWRQ
jgi:hypothetical protein